MMFALSNIAELLLIIQLYEMPHIFENSRGLIKELFQTRKLLSVNLN